MPMFIGANEMDLPPYYDPAKVGTLYVPDIEDAMQAGLNHLS
jgi:hypothetical protein